MPRKVTVRIPSPRSWYVVVEGAFGIPAGRAPEVPGVEGWKDWEDSAGVEGRVIACGKNGMVDVPVGTSALVLGSLSRTDEFVGEEEEGGGASLRRGGCSGFLGRTRK